LTTGVYTSVSEQAATTTKSLIGSSTAISIMTLLGILSSFLADALIAAAFGMGVHTDAFFAAYTVPISISTILMVACDSALVPIFAQQSGCSDEEISHFLSIILNVGAIILGVITLIGIVIPSQIIHVVSPGLSPSAGKIADSLTRILFFSILPLGLASILRAFLFSQRLFAIPAAMNAVQSGVVVTLILTVGHRWGITAVAVGYALGALVTLLVLVGLVLWRFEITYYFDFDLGFPGLLTTARQIAAPLVGLTLRRSMIVIERGLASYLAAGSITALSYANRISFVVVRVFLNSIMIAFLPALSSSVARRDSEAVHQQLLTSFQLLTLVSIPMGIGLSLMAVSVVQMLFQRGAFNQDAVLLMGSVLGLYSLNIIFMGHFQVLLNYFYAAVEPVKSLLMFLAITVTNLILAFALIGPWGVYGLALAFSFATALATGIGFVMLRQQLLGFPWRRLAAFEIKVLLASIVMGAVLYVIDRWFRAFVGALDGLGTLGMTSLAIGLGILSFLVVAWRLRLIKWSAVLDLWRTLVPGLGTPNVGRKKCKQL
jgi:putative peptidoglycan lipid II flippase